MKINPEFPTHRRNDPKRRSEALVYDQLAQSNHPAQALYELKLAPEIPEADFFVWVQDRGRFGIQVKGGMYSVEGTDWTLRTVNGTEHVDCPVTQTWDAATAVRDTIYHVLGFKVFIIPVLLFTDTPYDPAIEQWGCRRGVKVLFEADDLVDRLLALAEQTGVKHPPTAAHIMNEVDAVTGGLFAPAADEVEGPAGVLVDRQRVTPGRDGSLEAAQDLIPRQVVIHHVDTVNIHVISAHDDGRDLWVPPTS